MWKIILASICIVQLSQAFDIDGWVKKHCIKDKALVYPEDNFYCENPSFTSHELEDIQRGGFVISNHKNIIFKGGDIGILNENFLKKFPHCEILSFEDVKVKLDQSSELINHPIETIAFTGCKLSGLKDSLFFQHLQNLKNVAFLENELDTSVISKNLFGQNSKLISLILLDNDFEKIDDNAFEGLPNIEVLTLKEFLDHLSPHLLSGMNHLKKLTLKGNRLEQVPCDSIPESIEELSLTDNKIHQPSFKGCKFVKNLKSLYFGGNGIEHIDESVFEHFENIEKIYLDYNKLKDVSNDVFKNCKHLKDVKLSGNGIKKTDIRNDIAVEL